VPLRCDSLPAVIPEPLEVFDISLVTAVLAAFPNGSINVFDRDLRYVFAAGQGLADVGYSAKLLVGRTLGELFDDSLVQAVIPHYRLALSGEHVEFEFAVFARTYHMSVAPLVAADGTIPHIVVVTQDISARKRREMAVQDNEERLKAAEAALRALDRQKDAFISTLAHELRQPIGAMAAAVDVLKLRNPEIAAATPVAILHRQLEYVRRLLDDLVDATRLMRGQVTLTLESIDLRRVLQSALETVMPAVTAREQQPLVTMSDVPLIVNGDATRLQQVFSNLLHNASKYGRTKGRIWIVATGDAASVSVSVRDDGIGLEAETLPHVFELFTQASAQDRGGIGVGLAVVRSLVSAHAGTVEARSDGLDKGSEFIVRLPAADC
jgi:signal transduction histidine kinase